MTDIASIAARYGTEVHPNATYTICPPRAFTSLEPPSPREQLAAWYRNRARADRLAAADRREGRVSDPKDRLMIELALTGHSLHQIAVDERIALSKTTVRERLAKHGYSSSHAQPTNFTRGTK